MDELHDMLHSPRQQRCRFRRRGRHRRSRLVAKHKGKTTCSLNLGTDVHGKTLDGTRPRERHSPSPGPTEGKTMLLDSIIRQADSDGTLVTFTDQWDSIPPLPTIMCGRYRQPYELLEIVQRVSMEQRRRIKGEPEPIRPILLAFDDYDVQRLPGHESAERQQSNLRRTQPNHRNGTRNERQRGHGPQQHSPIHSGSKLYDRLIAGNLCYSIRPDELDPQRNLFSTPKTPVKPKPSHLSSTGIWTSNRPAICLYETSDRPPRPSTPHLQEKGN